MGAKTGLYAVKMLVPNNFSHKAGDGTSTRKRKLSDTVPALQANSGATQASYVVKQIGTRTDSNDGSQPFQQDRVYDPDGISPALQSQLPEGSHKISVVASRGRGDGWKQTLEERKDGVTNTLTGVEKDNMIKKEKISIIGGLQEHQHWRDDGISPSLTSAMGMGGGQTPMIQKSHTRIRRLTPVECERLQGYKDGWTATGVNEKGIEVPVSDSQRYKCCGNSVTTFVVASVMEKLYGGK